MWNARQIVAAGTVWSALACHPSAALAQVDPLTGIEMARIGAVNNPGYNREDPTGRVTGRGSVGYEYHIGRTELPSHLFLEFYNALKARPDPVPIPVNLVAPFRWGGEVDPNYSGPGTRYRLRSDLPNAAMNPVGGIDWRTCAILCNWLHNNKSTDANAFLNGAYDVSTFSPVPFPTFTDQRTHNPDARYWIPTWDEWLKAAHYDPNKQNGDGSLGGWWIQPNGTDIPLTYGLPASLGGSPLNQANAGFQTPERIEYTVPLKAYLDVQSPWGLWDVAGAAREWTEEIVEVLPAARVFDGTGWGSPSTTTDFVYGRGGDVPNVGSIDFGLRIASNVPSPGVPFASIVGILWTTRRIRRK
jgi:formylglycine-generating enzyme required for sulfatase activity